MLLPSAPSGSLFMVVAPSGAGKSTLVNALLAQDSAIRLSVSYTTRGPRPGEQNGREYHFVTVDDFLARREAGEFLESAEVHGNYYGTSRVWINEQMRAGTDVLLEIDWQGAGQVRRLFPHMVGIFILPPSFEELRKRLKSRGKDSPEAIEKRMASAREEISHVLEFEYIIVNEHFEVALADLIAVVRAARVSGAQQAIRLKPLIDEFR
jgi:guanylate kinase